MLHLKRYQLLYYYSTTVGIFLSVTHFTYFQITFCGRPEGSVTWYWNCARYIFDVFKYNSNIKQIGKWISWIIKFINISWKRRRKKIRNEFEAFSLLQPCLCWYIFHFGKSIVWPNFLIEFPAHNFIHLLYREPEFKKDFEETQQKCRDFAVAVLNVCRNSREVEMVLDDPANGSSGSK